MAGGARASVVTRVALCDRAQSAAAAHPAKRELFGVIDEWLTVGGGGDASDVNMVDALPKCGRALLALAGHARARARRGRYAWELSMAGSHHNVAGVLDLLARLLHGTGARVCPRSARWESRVRPPEGGARREVIRAAAFRCTRLLAYVARGAPEAAAARQLTPGPFTSYPPPLQARAWRCAFPFAPPPPPSPLD